MWIGILPVRKPVVLTVRSGGGNLVAADDSDPASGEHSGPDCNAITASNLAASCSAAMRGEVQPMWRSETRRADDVLWVGHVPLPWPLLLSMRRPEQGQTAR